MIALPVTAPLSLPAEAPPSVSSAPENIVAPRGTPIRLMVLNEVSTKTARPGDLFALVLDTPVTIAGYAVIARGARGVGKVVATAESGIAGRSGKLATQLLYLEVNGTRLALNGAPQSAGRGGTTQVVLATLALTPWGLFARGNNAKLKAGEIIVGSLAEDFAVPATPRPTPPVSPVADPVPPS